MAPIRYHELSGSRLPTLAISPRGSGVSTFPKKITWTGGDREIEHCYLCGAKPFNSRREPR
jgi:hypothetical protein